MTAGKWQAVQTDAGWHLVLKGANGEIVLTSEVYADKRSVQEAINLVGETMDLEVRPLEQVDVRSDGLQGGHTAREVFHAHCQACDWHDSWATHESRSDDVGAHRVKTGHDVTMWTSA